MQARLLVWFALFTYIFSILTYFSPPLIRFQEETQGEMFPLQNFFIFLLK